MIGFTRIAGTFAALALAGIAAVQEPAAAPPVAEPQRVEAVEAADCKTLGTRIQKHRCEETERKRAIVVKDQGSLGDIMQEDVAQGSSLNRSFND